MHKELDFAAAAPPTQPAAAAVGGEAFALSDQLEIVLDPVKGRCLAARVAIPAGTIVFEEPAAVFASAADGDQDFNRDLLAGFGDAHPLALMFEQLADSMADLDRVESLNTARNWLQLVALTLTPDPGLAHVVKPLVLSLEAKNRDECLASVKEFRASAPPELFRLDPTVFLPWA